MKISFKDGFKAGLGFIAAQVVAGLVAAFGFVLFVVIVGLLFK